MKMNKKKLLSLSLVIALIAILSLGSLAWFNAQDKVTNTFMIATSEGGDSSDPDDIFSVDVWEPVDTDGDGNLDDNNDNKIDEENKDTNGREYTNILPGSTYGKNPYVENTGAYDQWIRVSVSITEAKAWLEIMDADPYELAKIFTVPNPDAWEYDSTVYDSVADAQVYYYYYKYKLVPGQTALVFTDVVIPTNLTQVDFAKIADGDFQVIVKAEALQADNTGDSAKQAFINVGWTVGTDYPNS